MRYRVCICVYMWMVILITQASQSWPHISRISKSEVFYIIHAWHHIVYPLQCPWLHWAREDVTANGRIQSSPSTTKSNQFSHHNCHDYLIIFRPFNFRVGTSVKLYPVFSPSMLKRLSLYDTVDLPITDTLGPRNLEWMFSSCREFVKRLPCI